MGLSAHREMQKAVQDASDRTEAETIALIRRWLEERSDMAEFAVVLIAFDTDFGFSEPQAEEARE